MKPMPAVEDFEANVVAILPALRRYAVSLTKSAASAEDLVQDTVCNALAAKHRFIPFGPFAAWMRRIMLNRFLSDLRKSRREITVSCIPQSRLVVHAPFESYVALREMMDRLPPNQREMIGMIAIDGMSYEEVAKRGGFSVGTAKSRVCRLRRSDRVAAFR